MSFAGLARGNRHPLSLAPVRRLVRQVLASTVPPASRHFLTDVRSIGWNDGRACGWIAGCMDGQKGGVSAEDRLVSVTTDRVLYGGRWLYLTSSPSTSSKACSFSARLPRGYIVDSFWWTLSLSADRRQSRIYMPIYPPGRCVQCETSVRCNDGLHYTIAHARARPTDDCSSRHLPVKVGK